MRRRIGPVLALLAAPLASAAAPADGKFGVWLEDGDGARVRIAELTVSDGRYTKRLEEAAFTDHFLSMRPFKCVDGPDKTWCHVPYPYAIERDIRRDLGDLELDFLFLWRGRAEYGIDLWNGVYYVLEHAGDGLVGRMYEMDMNILSVPPETGEMRPVRDTDLEPADPESHWLPRLVVAPVAE